MQDKGMKVHICSQRADISTVKSIKLKCNVINFFNKFVT